MSVSKISQTAAPRRRAAIPSDKRLGRLQVAALQLLVLGTFLAAWQWVPQIMAVRRVIPAFDPFFVSSPRQVGIELSKLLTNGAPKEGVPELWPYLEFTLKGMLIGGALGTALGVMMGLLLSNSEPLRQVFAPFIHALNAMPRIALIPIFIIMLGATLKSSIVTAIVVVFFSVFYNAYTGGTSVPREMMQNAALLGASPLDMILKLRFRYVLVWTFAAIPNAISLALIAVVTAEILSGSGGVGRLIISALSTENATLVFSLVILLSVLGVLFVTIAEVVRRRVLHWWPGVR
jgi:NitT/TauT family transport system permease protein